MRPNPLYDALHFLTQPGWFTAAFWLLLLASVIIGALAWRGDPARRTPRELAVWGLRVLIGAMWWQQTLWKLPPYYTDKPDEPFGTTGLANWMKIMGEHASIALQADFVNNIVLPNFYLFAPVVYAAELLTALSLMLGVFVGLFGFIGALQIVNLWLGLYSAPNEWPWTYFFLIVLQLIFSFNHYGRSLGIDALLVTRPSRNRLVKLIA